MTLSARMSIERASRVWGVPAIQPAFADLYVIPAAVATKRAGGDPYVANPFDPWKRPMNYPVIWLRLSGPGLSPAVIGRVALVMFAGCLAALLAFFGPLPSTEALFLVLAGCSPAALLAIQRANTDLLALGVIAAAVFALGAARGRFAWLGYSGIAVAGLLKLFPLAAAVVVWRETGRRRWVAVAVGGLVCAGVVALNLPHLKQIVANTATGIPDAYGSRIGPLWASMIAPWFGWTLDLHRLEDIAAAVCVLLIAVAVRLGVRRRAAEEPGRLTPMHLDGLRAGAAIYVATFLFGCDFDYRLLFLVLGVPALWNLARRGSEVRSWSIVALVLIATVLWSNGLFDVWLGFLNVGASWALVPVLTFVVVSTSEWRAGAGDGTG